MTIASKHRIMLVAFIAFTIIMGATVILVSKAPPAAGIHKIADIVCDLMIAEVGSSYLFNRQPSNRPETPEESAQRRRRRMLAGAVFLTAGLVMLAEDIVKFL